MGKITVVNNISLDGVMQAPARADEDTRDGFSYGGWTIPYQDTVIGKRMSGMMAAGNGSLLLGRRTYEDLHNYWSGRTDNPFTEHLTRVHKYVASTTLNEPLPWQNSTLLKGDAIEAIASLTSEGQDLTILGSGALIGSLMAKGLIDTFVLLIFPIVLGTGNRLFSDNGLIRLHLTDSVVSTTGVIIATYQQAI